MSLTFFLAVAVSLLVIGVFYLIVLVLRPRSAVDPVLKQQVDGLNDNLRSSSQLIHQQMSQLTKELGDRLQENARLLQDANKHVGDRIDNAARVVGEVQNRLGKVEEATQKVFDVGKDIARLQEILRAPKLRGSLGELFLEDLLAQVLPRESYTLQFEFKNKQKVDAVIRSAQGLVPIDSKFPLENFNRILESNTDEDRKASRKVFLQDVKRHIDSISKKYILPAEGTLDIALMYIPAENVYYEIIIKQDGLESDLLSYAQERRVFPVSPNSFYAYLQTIAVGLRGMQMEKGIRDVCNQMDGLKKEFGKFVDEFALIGKHLSNAHGSYGDADRSLSRLGDKLQGIGLAGPSQDQPELRVLKGGEE